MSDRRIDPEEFDVEIFEKAKEDTRVGGFDEPLYTTAVNLDFGLDINKISTPDYEEIRKNKTAYALFLCKVREQEIAYQNAMRAVANAKRKANDRKIAVIILTIAEIITAIGISGLFTNDSVIFAFVLLAGIIMTGLSLYLNFKK